MTKSRHIAPPRRPWTRAEDCAIRRDYPDRPTAHIARELDRPVTSVYARAKSLGIAKSAEFQAGPFSGRLRKGHADRGIATRFKKGQVCWSKGLRRPGYAPGRMRETQFKKGHRPHNYRWPVGSVRIVAGGKGKPYLFEKVREASPWTRAWVQVHRLVWRRAGRRIPPRHVLIFKDGNQFNCALKNLLMNADAQNAKVLTAAANALVEENRVLRDIALELVRLNSSGELICETPRAAGELLVLLGRARAMLWGRIEQDEDATEEFERVLDETGMRA